MPIRTSRRSSSSSFVPLLAFVFTLSACLGRELKELNPCLVSAVNVQVKIDKIDKVDLLFMVDDSGSMKEEQIALSQQFKNIITVLTTGKRAGKPDFPPAKDLHLAVISSDLGVGGVANIDTCEGVGDDGIMLNEGRGPGCQVSYPRFLSYDAKMQAPDAIAHDFACIAALGTDGCGIEQQLESSLKALWPASNQQVQFYGFDADHQVGRGDRDNAGFLRTDPIAGLSVLAVVLVTDEEDCSVARPLVLTPSNALDSSKPEEAALAMQGLNTRCALNPKYLYPTSRYVNALKALRPGHEDLVIFAAIVGVPPETVSPEVLARTDLKDDGARAGFYRNILDHPAMQISVVKSPDGNTDLDEVRTSCLTGTGKAYPPRRIVEVASGFGGNGIVQSICQSDFTPAVDAIIDLISAKLGAVCLPHPLVRSNDGKVNCDVIWELPKPGMAASNTPTSCSDPGFPFLRPVGDDEKPQTATGGARCRVPQLAVQGAAGAQQPVPTMNEAELFSEGWFYDTFTADWREQCVPTGQPHRIGYSAQASPPKGVTIQLDCLDQTQRLETQRSDLATGEQPAIGDACSDVERNGEILSGDAACALKLADGTPDMHMFCHAEQSVCVASCESSDQCPPAWVCDDRADSVARAGGRKYCVNPTCGDTD